MTVVTDPRKTGVLTPDSVGSPYSTNLGPYGVPQGLWGGAAQDSFSSFDIYGQGFVQRPTVFFDPTAIGSLRHGTFNQPFNTQSDLIALIKNFGGNLAGQVVGIKRGTVTYGGLNLSSTPFYGSNGNPVFIVPYGDAEDLPVISAGTVYANTGNPATGWANTSGDTGGSPLVWKLALATEADVFDQSFTPPDPVYVCRYWKTSTTGVASEAQAIAALLANIGLKSPGASIYYGGFLYIYPYNGSPDFDALEVMSGYAALYAEYSDIATTGNITFAGINFRGGVNGSLIINPEGVTTSPTIENISIVGCQIGQAGTDFSGNGAGDHAFFIYGGSDAYRLSNALVAGNLIYDSLNGTGAYGAISGGHIKSNKFLNEGTLTELWTSVSNMRVHDNYYYGMQANHVALQNFANVGIHCMGNVSTGGGTISGTTNSASNTGNLYYRNVMLNLNNVGIEHIGAGCVSYNNLINSFTGAASLAEGIYLQDDQTSHTSSMAVENNIIISNNTTGNGGQFIRSDVAAAVITSKTNRMWAPGGNFFCTIEGTNYTSIASYNSAMSDTSTFANPDMAADMMTPQDISLFNAGTYIAGYNDRDWIGRSMMANGTDTLPAIGAVARP